MNEHKGRALGYVLAVLSSWAFVRIFALNNFMGQSDPVQIASKARTDLYTPRPPLRAGLERLEPFTRPQDNARIINHKAALELPSFAAQSLQIPVNYQRLPQNPPPTKTHVETAETKLWPDITALLLTPQYPAVPATTMPFQTNPILGKAKSRRHTRFYAYSFWRPDSGTNFVVNPGQFAGSQSGFVGEVPLRLDRNGNSQLALIFRGFAVPNDQSANEIGAGLNWRPISALPVSVAVEARLRANSNRKLVAYFVIAPKPLKLTPILSLNTYAQLGSFSGKNAVQFFDANARVDLTLFSRPHTKIVVGPMLSANIQNSKHRVEFGPSISADIGLGKTNFRLSADYRLQAAGDEARSAGPTFTVSTSF
jgi:hypothetical protein